MTTRIRILALLALLVVPLFTSTPAHGHADVLGSTPADGSEVAISPSVVSFSLSEEVDVGTASAVVLDASGSVLGELPTLSTGASQVARFDASQLKLDPGQYSVNFRVISSDGHPIETRITFGIKDLAALTDTPAQADETHSHSSSGSAAGTSGVTTAGLAHATESLARLFFALGVGLMLGSVAWSWAFSSPDRGRTVRRSRK